jgi:ribosome maturation factor RimP
MKKSIVILFAFCMQFLYAQSVQSWNSQNGHSFQGTFIRMDAQSVTLRGTDGKEVNVPIAALDTASQNQAQKDQRT